MYSFVSKISWLFAHSTSTISWVLSSLWLIDWFLFTNSHLIIQLHTFPSFCKFGEWSSLKTLVSAITLIFIWNLQNIFLHSVRLSTGEYPCKTVKHLWMFRKVAPNPILCIANLHFTYGRRIPLNLFTCFLDPCVLIYTSVQWLYNITQPTFCSLCVWFPMVRESRIRH